MHNRRRAQRKRCASNSNSGGNEGVSHDDGETGGHETGPRTLPALGQEGEERDLRRVHGRSAVGDFRTEESERLLRTGREAAARREREGAVTSLWNFKDGIVPAASEVAEAVRHFDCRLVHVDGETISLDDPLARIDLGDIAKGYIADAIASHLREAGVTSGIVNLGGNVLVIASRAGGAPWRIGIRHPGRPREAPMGVVEVADCSVVTSDLYERNVTLDGVFYHHILDRETGFPALADVRSGTPITPTSVEGAGLSTALLLMGRERALGFVQAREGCEAIVVGMDDRVHGTGGIGTRIPLRTTR